MKTLLLLGLILLSNFCNSQSIYNYNIKIPETTTNKEIITGKLEFSSQSHFDSTTIIYSIKLAKDEKKIEFENDNLFPLIKNKFDYSFNINFKYTKFLEHGYHIDTFLVSTNLKKEFYKIVTKFYVHDFDSIVKNYPEIKFETEHIDLGSVLEGPSAVAKFKFKNIGNTPLIIFNVSNCGGACISEWKKEPIAPGDSSIIIWDYCTQGRPGASYKTITISANTFSKYKYITTKVFVIEDKNRIRH